MHKFVKVTVSASLSTDFYIEVSEDADEVAIREAAAKEVIIPTDYPKFVTNLLKTNFNINVPLDSIAASWNLDEFEIIV